MHLSYFGQEFGLMSVAYYTPLLIWALFWKGLALWHSSQRKQPWWFVILLVVNTVGILEIIYLFAVLKLRLKELFRNQ